MTKAMYPQLSSFLIEKSVREALEEDLGRAGDITTLATIEPGMTATARIVARQPLVVCGLSFANTAYRLLNRSIQFKALANDGDRVDAGAMIAEVRGSARDMLSAERVGLNFLAHLSAISTSTAEFCQLIAHTQAQMCCTRKTIPGLRAFQKYAVRMGGGINHRFGLDDAVLIKDNHIAVCGSITGAIEQARAYAGHLVAIEIEVDTLEQLEEALKSEVDAILLDNFQLATLREAVKMAGGRVKLEASGGVNIDTVASVAETGVDYISTSKVTMAPPPVDIALDIDLFPEGSHSTEG